MGECEKIWEKISFKVFKVNISNSRLFKAFQGFSRLFKGFQGFSRFSRFSRSGSNPV